MEKCGRQKVSIKFFLHGKTQKCDVFEDVSSLKNIPSPERLQKHCVACNLVEIEVNR